MALENRLNKTPLFTFLTNPRLIFWLLVVITTVVSILQCRFGLSKMGNILISKTSFYNLIHHQNMYSFHFTYDGMWIDAFKYSPAFSLLYAPIAILPPTLGMIAWNLVNVITFFFAVRSLPFSDAKKALILGVCLLELILSIQNSQCNLLMAALMIFAFTALEKKHILLATFCVVLSVYIKLFGAVAFILFLFYPDKLKSIGYTILWSILFFALPLVIVSPTELMQIYHNWGLILKQDAGEAYGLSVMAIARAWFGITSAKMYMQLAGAILLLIPLLSFRSYNNFKFRILYLASILLWVVTFNHKSESPSFIIAMAGIAIWYVTENASPVNIALLVFAFVLTSLSHSDIIPTSAAFKANVIDAYIIKGLPAFVMWVVIQTKLYLIAFTPQASMDRVSIDG